MPNHRRGYVPCKLDNCEGNVLALGFCRRHYRALKRNGTPELDRRPPGWWEIRLSQVLETETNECIVWDGVVNADGYGIGGKGACPDGSALIHRAVLWATAGPPPSLGMEAAHGPCHNRACVNPRHLSWETRLENLTDMLRDGSRQQGETHSRAKLTAEQVREIRRRYASGEPQRGLGFAFGVSQMTISHITSGKTWRSVGA